jgi:hypothetical protein
VWCRSRLSAGRVCFDCRDPHVDCGDVALQELTPAAWRKGGLHHPAAAARQFGFIGDPATARLIENHRDWFAEPSCTCVSASLYYPPEPGRHFCPRSPAADDGRKLDFRDAEEPQGGNSCRVHSSDKEALGTCRVRWRSNCQGTQRPGGAERDDREAPGWANPHREALLAALVVLERRH